MGLLDTVIITLVVIVLLHLTLKNFLVRPMQVIGKEMPASPGEAPVHPARDEMLDFVRGHLLDLDRNRRRHPKGSNYYNDFHDSDLHHELTDLSKFFEVEQSVPDTKQLLREINGPECGPNGIKDCKQTAPSLRDPQTGGPMRFDSGSDGTAAFLPDQWSYKNEKPMNGGLVDGVRAFDEGAGAFSVYPASDERKQANFLSSYPYTTTFSQW